MGAVTLQSALGNPTLQQRRWASKLTQEQITEYKGVFEMFDEEGNRDVKTQELERLMGLIGINPKERELSQMAKDDDYKHLCQYVTSTSNLSYEIAKPHQCSNQREVTCVHHETH
ncbi:hypothetical protein NQZ68_027928 [Dissostichus eleginoides]|nr:hypothetical protein NQZ68_027928 [Dissostichus eleginoides]